jgi:hypothetical protein
MLNHKETAKHVRNRLKVSKIKARVRMYEACGIRYIAVITPEYGAHFNPEQLKEIGIIASVNGLTEAQGSPVNMDIIVQMTGKDQFNFEYHGDRS